MEYAIILAALYFVELLYFKIASYFNIIDKPNLRSSHSNITLRGGGIIFPISMVAFFVVSGYNYAYVVIGLIVISLVSFIDDVRPLSNKIRLFIHLLAVALLFFQMNTFHLEWYFLLSATVVVIGIINAYNFMDGINGITGLYSLSILSIIYFLNIDLKFIDEDLLIYLSISLCVFLFFNLRKKARCFAGDVGSVSIAFMIVFLVGTIIYKTNNFSYFFLLLIYGVDTISTIVFRLLRGENIFEAHRSHFYQFLANEKSWSHVKISIMYAAVQLSMSAIMFFILDANPLYSVTISILFGAFFIILRFAVEGKRRLLERTKLS